MRAKEFLTEYRTKMFQYIKSLLPKWPDYVLKDWIYNLARGDHKAGAGDKRDSTDNFLWGFNKETILAMLEENGLSPDTKWTLVPNMKFTIDMFNPWTKEKLIGRAGGKSDLGMGIPKDKERHATQAQLAKQQGGVRKEPVILIKKSDGYELLEGWHRTIQHFAMYPDGYTGPAYIAVSQQNESERLDEVPLPPDWDPEKLNLRQTYKNRLNYALERAKRLGTGSSRVAMTIEYEGRPTVLKVAKNAKGLAQNEAEIEILKDGYVGKLPIVIPLIDYDKENRRPVWIQTELAQKIREPALRKLLHTPRLWFLTDYVALLLGKSKKHKPGTKAESMKSSYFKDYMWDGGHKPTEKDWEIFAEYGNEIADLVGSSTIEIGDLSSANNWGIYNNRPVIIDLGFTEETSKLYGFNL